MNRRAMFYRETAPSGDVSPLILSFWEFVVSGEAPVPVQHEIFPDGCVSLFYHRNPHFNISRLAFSGLYLESIVAPVFPGDVFWGMRISPAACAVVLRDNPVNFRAKRMAEAEDFPHLTGGILEKLNDCRDFGEFIVVCERRLKEINFGQNSYDEMIVRAVKIIEESSGEIKIAELARQINLSVRQLERRFKKSSGLSPKQFARARRIRATAVILVENETVNWATRAAEMGFSDQSHLTHEFVSVTGRSPNSFAEKVKQIEHGNLV